MTQAPLPGRSSPRIADLEVRAVMGQRYGEILDEPALAFLARLERRFRDQRNFLLMLREARKEGLARGGRPDFPAETEPVRRSDWTVDPVPDDLLDRRVEITVPVDRKRILQAMHSGANVCIADFEDATSPTWTNLVEGQISLKDAVRGTIAHPDATNGQGSRSAGETATLVVRPRGWQLEEKHVLLDGVAVSAAIFDFALYFWHNAKALIARGSGPYFYLPKLESHLEARLWNSVFCFAQDELGIPRATIKAAVLIETVFAAFEMDEILYQLREHSAGLACGRRAYVFSFIKTFKDDPSFVLPDRALVTMQRRFLASCSELVIRTCHRRGAHAIGGMAARIPVKDDPERNTRAMARVRADKRHEALAGHDGTRVAHPGLVDITRAEFDAVMRTPNQIDRQREEVRVTQEDLLAVPAGPRTEAALRHDVRVGVIYLAAWLTGSGCVAIDGLMEDAATAETARAQVWQRLRHGVELDTGRKVDLGLVRRMVLEALAGIERGVGGEAFEQGRYRHAARLFESLVSDEEFPDCLTHKGYALIVSFR